MPQTIKNVTTEYERNWIKFVLIHSSEWKTNIRDRNCPCKTNAVARAKHLIERLRVCVLIVVRDFHFYKLTRFLYEIGFLAALASRSRNTLVNLQRWTVPCTWENQGEIHSKLLLWTLLLNCKFFSSKCSDRWNR